MKNKILKIILFGTIVLLMVCAIMYNQLKTKELKKNGVLLNAQVKGISFVAKGSSMYKYSFYYDGSFFLKESSTGIKKLNFIVGRFFPVIFSPKTHNCELLISPEDFSKFDLPFPDSLKWVIIYKNN